MEEEVDAVAGSPHEAVFLVLAYLPLYELLVTGRVCRSLRHAVDNDVLLWLNLVVQEPLNRRISDHELIQFTSISHGRLATLALINCTRITDQGLLTVVATNPLISKLLVPGCTGLTPDGILTAVKSLTHLRCLHVNGIYNLNQEHLQMLQSHLLLPLGSENQNLTARFYHDFGDRGCCRPIDVEICPTCNQVKMVFDCPREECRTRFMLRQCKGCYQCIARCVECGTCLPGDADDESQFDAACLDFLCSKCWFRLPKCNHCNKPYCRRHAGDRKSPDGSAGFICSICNLQHLSSTFNEETKNEDDDIGGRNEFL
ncbi:hypothetical protein Dimus_014597 [Dionaea muscipula]